MELSQLQSRYAQSTSSAETRFISGYRSHNWLLAINPVLDFGLSNGQQHQSPDFNYGIKATRYGIWPGLAPGLEYYSDLGPLQHPLNSRQQDKRLFASLDVDLAPWVFNVGLGKGLSPTADRWTLKFIFEVPLQHPGS